MEILETLAVAFGFASLAGINLYLTVLVTGLAVHFNWIELPAKYADLLVLGEPPVLIAAGVFAALEFFSDKVPWVDSAWDSIHTLIRPVGGGLLGLAAVGTTDPVLGVIVGMLAGGTSLMTHGLKSGTRIAINQSPEPVSNMAMSVTEDIAVVSGLAMMSISPLTFAGICVVAIVVTLVMAPRLYRRCRTYTWLVGKWIQSLFTRNKDAGAMKQPLSVDDKVALSHFFEDQGQSVRWSLPVVVGAKRGFGGITANTFGRIFSLESDCSVLHLVGKKNGKRYHSRIDLKGLDFRHESKLVCENVIFENRAQGKWLVLRLTKDSTILARRVVDELRDAAPSATATQTGMAAEIDSESKEIESVAARTGGEPSKLTESI